MEFDALLLAGCPAPAPDALPNRDAKAGADAAPGLDPRVQLLVEDCWRHAKVIGAWGAGQQVLDLAGITGAPGVVGGDDATAVLAQVQELMGNHRVWERFPVSVT